MRGMHHRVLITHSSVISLLALGEGEGSDTIARGFETPGRHDEERSYTSLDGGCQACLARSGSASCSTLGRTFFAGRNTSQHRAYLTHSKAAGIKQPIPICNGFRNVLDSPGLPSHHASARKKNMATHFDALFGRELRMSRGTSLPPKISTTRGI